MEPVQDPLKLVDRNMQDSNVAYQTFVSDAEALDAMTTSWYSTWREHKGEPGGPALSDKHHGYWRGISREAIDFGFRTLRQAYNDAWPLPSELQPPFEGGGGGTGTPRLHPQGHYFVQEGGAHWTAVGATDFNLMKLACDGGDLDTILAQRQACGFNMVRVFLVGDWGDPAYLCRPQDHPDYYDKLHHLADRCAAHGLYFQACAFTDSPRVFPTLVQQQAHWSRTCEALAGHENVLLELVNENDVPVNHVDETQFSRPSGITSSHGSNGSQSLAVRPWWDWEAFHTNAAPEEQRKIGHNAMELADGAPDWPPSHAPVITNETSRYPEVGMWRNGNLGRQQMLAYDSAAGAALLCAGSVFHSVNGKLSRLWDANEEAVARSWADGARSVPLEFQGGHYRRYDTAEPTDILRTYARVLGDGREHRVVIHK